MDGDISQEAPVLLGVPQGTVLAPCYSSYLLTTENVSSPIRLFADDCLICREIRSLLPCLLNISGKFLISQGSVATCLR